MAGAFRIVHWTSYKKRYDVALLSCVGLYLLAFFIFGKFRWRRDHAISDEILLIRALGTCAFALLNVTLSIGPLTRLDRRFLPLLYNRRHLGVTTFFVALAHALLVLGFYHGFGVLSPIRSLLTSNVQYRSLAAFPFEVPGVIALLILLLMAATSHDLWLKKLTPQVWKSLHMLVYIAWALIVAHVALGALQSERSTGYTVAIFAIAAWIPAIHLIAGRRELRMDNSPAASNDSWIDVASIDEIVDGHAKVICLPQRERVAVYRNGDEFSAVANVCAHQGGPVGEGRIIDGCITCPWHGYQYRPQDGRSPPPFTERLPVYPLRIVDARILINPESIPGRVA